MLYGRKVNQTAVEILNQRLQGIQDKLEGHYRRSRTSAMKAAMDSIAKVLSDMSELKTNESLHLDGNKLVIPKYWDRIWNAIFSDLIMLGTAQGSIETAIVENFNYSESEYLWLNERAAGLEQRVNRFGVAHRVTVGGVSKIVESFNNTISADMDKTTARIDTEGGVLTLQRVQDTNVLATKLRHAEALASCKFTLDNGSTYNGAVNYGQMYGIVNREPASKEDVPRPALEPPYHANNKMFAYNLKKISDTLEGGEGQPDTFAEVEWIGWDKKRTDEYREFYRERTFNKNPKGRNILYMPIQNATAEELSSGTNSWSIFAQRSLDSATLRMTLTYDIESSDISTIRVTPFAFANVGTPIVESIELLNNSGVTRSIDVSRSHRTTGVETITSDKRGSIRASVGTVFAFETVRNVRRVIFTFRQDQGYYLKYTMASMLLVINGNNSQDRYIEPATNYNILTFLTETKEINENQWALGAGKDMAAKSITRASVREAWHKAVQNKKTLKQLVNMFNVPAEKSDRKRWAIGIRDIFISAPQYKTLAEYISQPIDIPHGVYQVYLSSSEFIPEGLQSDNIRYFVHFEDSDSDYREIVPIEATEPRFSPDTGNLLPRLITVNSEVPEDRRIDPAGKAAFFDSVGPIRKIRIRIMLTTKDREQTPMLYNYTVNLIDRPVTGV